MIPKKRWFRFSLKTFFVVLTIFCVVFGLLVRRFQEERAAEDALIANGLTIAYEPWGGAGYTWHYPPNVEQKEAYKTFLGRLKWDYLRHTRLVSGQRSAQLSDDPSNISDVSLKPLRQLRHVEVVQLGFQPITDAGLTHISHLGSLKSLNLCGTKVTNNGLAALRSLKNLEDIALEFTEISDAGLRHLIPLTKLRALDMMDAKLTGSGFQHLAELKSLESLGISDMAIHSDDLKWLSGLPNLYELSLSNTLIDDDAAKHIAKLSTLHTLTIDGTAIGDDFIAGISALKNLRYLNIDGTNVTESSVKAITRFPKLEFFSAWDAHIGYGSLERIDGVTSENESENFEEIIGE